MANELDIKKENLVSLVGSHNLGEIIKPLVKEVHLFDSRVAGTTHLEDKSVLDTIQVGSVFSLQREDNEFDKNAILILSEDKRKVGYVPEKDNLIFARLMDAGKLLRAKVTETEWRGKYMKISIGIYLVDF